MQLGNIVPEELIDDMNYYLNVPQRPGAMDIRAKTARININCAFELFRVLRDNLQDNPPNNKEDSVVANAAVSRLRDLFNEFNIKRAGGGGGTGGRRRRKTHRRRHAKKKKTVHRRKV